jgi:peptide chain release factor 3
LRKKEGEMASLPAQLKFDVYPATQFCVDRGANEGDALGTFAEVEAGDIYRMRKDASALTLAIRDDADGTQLVAEGSQLGRAGDKLTIAACHQLMTPDGTLAEILTLTIWPAGQPAHYILPLCNLEPGEDYELVGSEAETASLRFADIACLSFLAGTHLTVASGAQIAVEALQEGDLLLTRENGARPVRWIGRTVLRGTGSTAPVLIRQGALRGLTGWQKTPQPLAYSHRLAASSPFPKGASRHIPRPMSDISPSPLANRPALPPEIGRRRTFAIISHPDAGKTTLTEKFLLYGGAIQMAGQVRAKGEARRTRSDFMKMEQDRGISVSASAMSFDYREFRFNLVDTPGHSDFSEDTYRTLTAVDAAIMVIDGAKGVESQTQKLFEVCRLRDLPILTFCNKMDRESRDTFEIIDEIQENLAIDVAPASWPIGMGRDFLGCYDLIHDRLELMDRADRNRVAETVKMSGLDDPKLADHIPEAQLAKLREEIEMARELLPAFDRATFLAGAMTPIWFGSAINSFGVRELMEGIAEFGPAPQVQTADPREIAPEEGKVTGFVFKVQANMDPKHRDRVAFIRLASGHFERGMKLHHVRSKKPMAVSNPVLFLAADRELAEEAWAGDIIGIPNHGQLRIGDALTEGEALRFTGIPSFAPELLQVARAGDPMKAKHLEKALMQFAEEGAAKIFKPQLGSGFIVGVVGALQFEVLASRIELEYGLPVRFEASQFTSARWVHGARDKVDAFATTNKQHMAVDNDGDPVYLTRLQWDIDRVERDYPDVRLSATKELMV